MPKKMAKTKAAQLPTRFLPPRSSANRQGSFPKFLDMPLELRHLIYSHLLLSPTSVDVWSAQAPDDPLTNCSCNRRLDVAILRTNKQIHGEATQYLYSTNTFTFMEPCDYHEYDPDAHSNENPVMTWLLKIGLGNSRHIRSLQLRIRTERNFEDYYCGMFRTLANQIPNLTRIAVAAEKHKSCKILRYEGPPGMGSVEYDGEDTDDEAPDEEPDDDMVLVWNPSMGMLVGPIPKIFKSYFVTAIPPDVRVALAKELRAFKQLGLILVFGKHNKQPPSLKEFCGQACLKLSHCSVQETHDTKLARLALPWDLEVANEYQWKGGCAHKVDHTSTKPKKEPADSSSKARAGHDEGETSSRASSQAA